MFPCPWILGYSRFLLRLAFLVFSQHGFSVAWGLVLHWHIKMFLTFHVHAFLLACEEFNRTCTWNSIVTCNQFWCYSIILFSFSIGFSTFILNFMWLLLRKTFISMLWLSPDTSGSGTFCPVEHYLCEVLVPNFRTFICLFVQQGFSFIYLFFELDPKV